MKIGEFAKKHQVSVDTVRHYINEGLLTPFRESSQYSFSDIDDRVMDSILLMKCMNFKLQEMKAYLLFQTMYTNNSFSYLGSFRKEFEDKLEENKKEIKRLQKMNQLIEQQIEKTQKLSFKRGISLRMVQELICPECDENLELEDSTISHNEITEGKLICPKCGRIYYIRYGVISDEPIDVTIEGEGLAEMFNRYLECNDEHYIFKVREIFQKVAEITGRNSLNAKNVLIDGDSSDFLCSSIIRSLPGDARLFVHIGQSINMKLLQEDILPKDTVIYRGDMKKIPFKVPMDYLFLQDYDVDTFYKGQYRCYPYIAPGAVADCFKAYIYGKQNQFPDEASFLNDMKKFGLKNQSVYRTGKILNKKDSSDMTIIEKKDDMEMEYAIYSFKTLG